jgi:hypothetical protein
VRLPASAEACHFARSEPLHASFSASDYTCANRTLATTFTEWFSAAWGSSARLSDWPVLRMTSLTSEHSAGCFFQRIQDFRVVPTHTIPAVIFTLCIYRSMSTSVWSKQDRSVVPIRFPGAAPTSAQQRQKQKQEELRQKVAQTAMNLGTFAGQNVSASRSGTHRGGAWTGRCGSVRQDCTPFRGGAWGVSHQKYV